MEGRTRSATRHLGKMVNPTKDQLAQIHQTPTSDVSPSASVYRGKSAFLVRDTVIQLSHGRCQRRDDALQLRRFSPRNKVYARSEGYNFKPANWEPVHDFEGGSSEMPASAPRTRGYRRP